MSDPTTTVEQRAAAIAETQEALRHVAEQIVKRHRLSLDEAHGIISIAVERNLVPAGVETEVVRRITIPFSRGCEE